MINNETGKENDQERILIQKLLSAKDVAEILGISVKTVNKLVREAELGCVQVTAKERRFTEEQIRNISNPAAPMFKLTRQSLTA